MKVNAKGLYVMGKAKEEVDNITYLESVGTREGWTEKYIKVRIRKSIEPSSSSVLYSVE